MYSTRLQHQQHGFTLLELLVVIVIISIILSFATFAVKSGDPGERLETEANRLATLIRLAQDESLLRSKQFALALDETSYKFLLNQGQQWQPVSDDKIFRARSLPEDMEMELEVDNQAITLDSSVTKIGEVSKVGDVSKFESSEDKKMQPQLFILSSGEIAPVCTIRIYIPGLDPSYLVHVQDDGTLKIEFQPS